MASPVLAAPVTYWPPVVQRRALIWLLAILCSVLVLLAPALWNGFPFIFYDSGAFIDLAIRGGFMPERSAYYASFLGAFWPSYSLWPAVIAQATMSVVVIAEFSRILLPGLSPRRFFVLIVALCICTGLPWDAARVLPDILAPLLVLCLYLLGFHAAALRWPEKAALIAVSTFAATSHASHLGLAAGLAALTAVMQVATLHKVPTRAGPRWRLPGFVFALSLLMLVVSNFALTGEVFVSRAGPSFILARLIKDGIAKRVLDDTCPQSGYRLCAYKDNLPADGNDYLWGWPSPFWKLGGFEGTAEESQRIIIDSLKRYPLLNLKMAISNTVEQFTTFETGDGIEQLHGVPLPAMRRDIPGQVGSYKASREKNDEIGFKWINALQVPIGALSIVTLAAILVTTALSVCPEMKLDDINDL
jgi:hypothetical protein